MRVELLTSADDDEYSEFLDRLGAVCPSVLAYHYPFYRDMLREIGMGQPCYTGAWWGGELVGVLPGFLRKSSAGSAFCSLPFFGPNGGVVCDPHGETELIHRSLLGGLMDHLGGLPDLLTASFYTPFLFDRYEFYEQAVADALVVERTTLYLYLPDVPSRSKSRKLWAAEPRPGVEIYTGVTPERIRQFYEVYRQNCVASEIPMKPFRAVERVMTEGCATGRARCYFAYHGGDMIAGLVMLWGPSTASYYIPCTRPEMRPLQPGTALAGRALREAMEAGLQYWNWEGSPSRESGVFRFKAKWGSVESGYRIYVRPFAPPEVLRSIGIQRLASEFPFVYVYPRELLATAGA